MAEPAPVSAVPKQAAEPSYAKTYLNKKYGFSFQYPSAWQQMGKEVEAINRKGIITSVEVSFADTLTATNFSAIYYLPPTGAEIFKYQLGQFNASQGWYAKHKKQLNVAGQPAIYGMSTLSIDGKGNLLNTPLQMITVEFADNKTDGAFCLQLKKPVEKDSSNNPNVEQVINSFVFIE